MPPAAKTEGEEAPVDFDANRRVFQFFDINILDERNPPTTNLSQEKIPRRIVISFLQDIDANRLAELTHDIKTTPNFTDIFVDDNIKIYKPKPDNVKGHLKNDETKGTVYVPHKRQKDPRKKNTDQRQVKH